MRQNLIQKIGIPQIVVVLIAIVAPLILTGVNFSYGILILNFMLVYVVAVSGSWPVEGSVPPSVEVDPVSPPEVEGTATCTTR